MYSWYTNPPISNSKVDSLSGKSIQIILEKLSGLYIKHKKHGFCINESLWMQPRQKYLNVLSCNLTGVISI